jgi:thymidylate synthase (FAD)
MKIVKAGYEFITPVDGEVILNRIESVARTCYKSESKSGVNCENFVRNLIKRGHEAMLEHCSFTVKFTVDRGVSHELVRHRVASFAQESTRYCNYAQDKFGHEISVIEPPLDDSSREVWRQACEESEKAYFQMIDSGVSPQIARSVLPTCLKTEIVMTANLREWRHFFKLRAEGVTGSPHPQMLEVAVPLLEEVKRKIPVIFDDIHVKEDLV